MKKKNLNSKLNLGKKMVSSLKITNVTGKGTMANTFGVFSCLHCNSVAVEDGGMGCHLQ